MLGKTYDAQVCSIARTLEVVGERWSLLIIRDALFAGATRFNDFQRGLGIATNILKSRLDGFEDSGIMYRDRYSEQPELFAYKLTDKGRDLAHSLVALTQWGDRWATEGEPPILYRHSCGGELTSRTVCDACGVVDDPTEVRAIVGPGMPATCVPAGE
ncbi:MAG: helix-turn-helix transcriptional regulator [Catenulispora sp.]|nr:helix-turn-helix transcriptional regulator [Catenulispora sp.]